MSKSESALEKLSVKPMVLVQEMHPNGFVQGKTRRKFDGKIFVQEEGYERIDEKIHSFS